MFGGNIECWVHQPQEVGPGSTEDCHEKRLSLDPRHRPLRGSGDSARGPGSGADRDGRRKENPQPEGVAGDWSVHGIPFSPSERIPS